MVELDFVYRSLASEMAPAVDAGWLSDELLVVGFLNGLAEVVNVDSRELISAHRLEGKSITGICVVDTNHVAIQTKGDSITFFRLPEWKVFWSISTKKAVSFARPVIIDRTVCFVINGQAEMGFVNIDTGNLEYKLLLPESPGLVTAIENHENNFKILTESGTIFSVSGDGSKINGSHRIVFPDQSAVPTSMVSGIVGFSDGSIFKDGSLSKSMESGIGALTVSSEGILLVGGWDGTVLPCDNQPHIASIRSITSRANRVAVASTDGRVSLWYLDNFII